jgi:hypothetical protein
VASSTAELAQKGKIFENLTQSREREIAEANNRLEEMKAKYADVAEQGGSSSSSSTASRSRQRGRSS